MKKTSIILLSLALISPVIAAEPAQLELAQKVIKASQVDRLFDQMGGQMQQMAVQTLSMSAPNLTPEQKEKASKMTAEISQLALDATKEMVRKMDTVYAEVYSEAELKAMLAFFDSPEGKSMLQKQPQVMQRMSPLIQAMQRELMPKIQQIVEKTKTEIGVTPTGASSGPMVLPAAGGPAFKPASPGSTGPVPIPAPKNSPGPVPTQSAPTDFKVQIK